MEGAEILQGQGRRGDLAAAAIAGAGHDDTTRRLAQARDAGRGRGSRRPSGASGQPIREARISADTALRLARYFGTSERFWINLQARYDLEVEKDRLGAALDAIQPLSAAG